ncbi:MAG: ATP-binding protein, partial [Ignavibacteriae bacterium]|nr:ATP-binding protein [Ignavibacteriota bacterium]
IKHAYKGNEENIINILLEYSENKFKVVLEDTGIERANLDKPTLEFDPEDVDSLPEGGMGLFIIEQLMNEVNYQRIGNKNSFTMVKNF